MKVRVIVHHLRSGKTEVGIEEIEDNDDMYEELKQVIANAVSGKLSYLKLFQDGIDIYIPRDILIKSNITLKKLSDNE